jgi:HlyD family secretion protein
VAEADVGGVVEGQEVSFTVDAYPERTFHGGVTQVRNSPTTVNNVVTYDCVIGVTNADNKLKPGMTANVSIIVAQRDNVLTIPNAALRFRVPDNAVVITNTAETAASPATNGEVGRNLAGAPGGPGARRPGGGRGRGERPSLHTIYELVDEDSDPKLKAIQIRTGITDGLTTEVISGLDEGAKVVTTVVSASPQAAAPAAPMGGFPRMR